MHLDGCRSISKTLNVGLKGGIDECTTATAVGLPKKPSWLLGESIAGPPEKEKMSGRDEIKQVEVGEKMSRIEWKWHNSEQKQMEFAGFTWDFFHLPAEFFFFKNGTGQGLLNTL